MHFPPAHVHHPDRDRAGHAAREAHRKITFTGIGEQAELRCRELFHAHRTTTHIPADRNGDRTIGTGALFVGADPKRQCIVGIGRCHLDASEVARLAPHKVVPGNRPSNTLVLSKLDPQRLGALIALYEHKIFIQSVIWGINAFDQWGVELGKELGDNIFPLLQDKQQSATGDSSTLGLIQHFHAAGPLGPKASR